MCTVLAILGFECFINYFHGTSAWFMHVLDMIDTDLKLKHISLSFLVKGEDQIRWKWKELGVKDSVKCL